MQIRQFNRVSLFIGMLAVALLIAGCKDNGLEKVTGTVTLDDQPLADASVEFLPVDPMGSTASGRTDDSGDFVMEFSRSEVGVAAGEYTVSISTFDIADPQNDIAAKPEQVPAIYNKKTELTATVVDGEKNHFEFDLKGKGDIAQPRVNDDES